MTGFTNSVPLATETPEQDSLFFADVFFDDIWNSSTQAGVDEVGIGPLAGPVTACAVLLDPNRPIGGLNDSKVLTARRREALSVQIEQCALDFALGWADVAEIDRYNILRASHLAMTRALSGLKIEPVLVLVDGNKTPCLPMACIAVVKGDGRVPQISAASILAKVARDRFMQELDLQYPQYGFAQHKGYPTKSHVTALERYGATPVHRRSFAPVRRALGIEENEFADAATKPRDMLGRASALADSALADKRVNAS
jgi:ribonuclease HII